MKRKVITTIMTMLFLASMLIGTFEVAAAAGVELAYDDGECDLIYPTIHFQQYLRQRFLVSDFGISDDCLVETVRIFWFGTSAEEFTGVIKLRDYDTGEVVTAASLGAIPTDPSGQWYDYDVSGSGFVSDHFYVELWQTSPSPSGGLVCGDLDEPQGMSECSTNFGETWRLFGPAMNFMIRVIVTPLAISATIDIDPDTLNLVGNGPWITAYIELPSGYDVADIDVASIELSCNTYTGGVYPDAPMEIGDYDGDGIPDLMVKFDRFALTDYLQTSDFDGTDGKFYDLPITITGTVAGTPFEGIDTIRVRR